MDIAKLLNKILRRKKKSKVPKALAILLGMANLVLLMLYLVHAHRNFSLFADVLLRPGAVILMLVYMVPVFFMAFLFYMSYSVLRGRREHKLLWWVCLIVAGIPLLIFGLVYVCMAYNLGVGIMEIALACSFAATGLLAMANSVYHLKRKK